MKQTLLIAITDGLGLRLSFIHKRPEQYEKYRRWYILAPIFRRRIEEFNDSLLKQLGEKYGFIVNKVNVAYGKRGIPCFLGYKIKPSYKNQP